MNDNTEILMVDSRAIPTKVTESMDPSHDYLRRSIREHLSLLRRELGHYEQTTHGSITAVNCSLKEVVEALLMCYNTPSAYNISELEQRICGFLGKYK